MDPIRYTLGSRGGAIRDIQRKLASLDPKGEPALVALQAAPCSGHYDFATASAINAFKARHGIGSADGICDEETWLALNEHAGSVFAETWQFELDAIRGPIPEGVAPVREELVDEAHRQQLAGLAFSGGGIRSATFNLGMLQALAELHMLRDFDYLSTVSGGGYIGAWFSKWLKQREGNIVNLERELTPGSRATAKREPEEVKFLRQYTNYLTPKTGVFSADTWSLLATYVRNTVLNLTILVALLAMLMIVPRLLVAFVDSARANPAWITALKAFLHVPPFVAFAVLAALWSVFWIAASVSTRPVTGKAGRVLGQSQSNIIVLVVVPLMLAAFFGSVALWEHHEEIDKAWDEWPEQPGAIIHWLYLPGVAYFFAWGAGWAFAHFHNWRADIRAGKDPAKWSWREIRSEGPGHLLCAVAAMAVGVLMVIMVVSALHTWHAGPGGHSEPAANPTVAMVAFGMPILLNLFGITMILCVGLVGSLYTDKSREWWSRQSGWVGICVMAWLALVTVSLYAPPVVAYFHAKFGAAASGLLGTAWFSTTLAGLLIGKSSATGAPGRQSRLEWLARAAPLIFSIGALCLVSSGLHLLLQPHMALHDVATGGEVEFSRVVGQYAKTTVETDAKKLWLALVGLALLGGLLAWRVDINKFSLHMMYRNRLVRAYLGASNNDRQPHPFTGFDPADEVHLDQLLGHGGKLQRPYHIINTALNLVNGKELAWQTRKAAGFTFTPAFCGFELPSMASPGYAKLVHEALRGGFRRTRSYRPEDPQKPAGPTLATVGAMAQRSRPKRAAPQPRHEDEIGINLGMAVAVSGAAASPNMGFNSSPPLAFLMTLFNVRLGRWFANPIRPHRKHLPGAAMSVKPPRTSPRVGLWYLLKELFGLTDAKANFVYLSDGGHFENLGVYELVRRRCRLIVVVDAGADGQFSFEDLGNAIRKCGTDLHVEIEIDVGQIDRRQPAEFSQSHCVTGKIRYDKVDQGAPSGTLLYIKPSLLGNEFADVLNYRKTNKRFPHQPTADQWFDETQFETYRSLGYRIGKIAMAEAVAMAAKKPDDSHKIDSLCVALETVWEQTGGDQKMRSGVNTSFQNRRMAQRRLQQVVPEPPLAMDRRQIERRQA
jgi:hypothetical protein